MNKKVEEKILMFKNTSNIMHGLRKVTKRAGISKWKTEITRSREMLYDVEKW